MAEPVLVLDGDAPTVVIQNDLLRYLFSDDDDGDWCIECGVSTRCQKCRDR